MQHTTFNKSVSDLNIESTNGTINPNPIGQRPPVSEGWGKAKGIISSIIKGYSIGSITLRDISNDTDNQKVYSGTQYLVIDGGHRIRSIRDYMMNKFAVEDKRFIDLSDTEQSELMNVQINIISYSDITNRQATEIFRRLNTVTPVNAMEMIMSNDTSNFAKEIRSRVSFYSEYENKVHPLFDSVSKNGKKPSPVNWSTDVNPRRKWDEFVALAIVKVIGGGNTNAGLELVEDLVENDAPVSSKKLKVVDQFLTDVLEIRKSLNKKVNTDTFSAMQAVWFGLYERSKEFKITDYKSFAQQFYKAHSVLTGNNTNKYDTMVKEFKINEHKTENKIVKEFARRAIRNYSNSIQQREVSALYIDMMNITTNTLFRDERRSVSRDVKFNMLANQNFLCAIDGKELDIDDAIFGHDTPWSKGGQIEDGMIIRKSHNVDMGTMTISEYKAYLEFKEAV